jgi:hypothetical protein
MSYVARLYDFTPNTLIQSSQVDDEFNQLVALLNGTSSAGVDVTFKGELRTTQNLLVAPVTRSGTASPFVRFQTPGDSGLTADTESTGMVFGGTSGSLTQSRTFAAGGAGFTTQREVRFVAPTYAFNSADTITDAIHVEIDTPRAGSNATLTNSHALKLVLNANAHQGLWIDNSSASPSGNLFSAGLLGTKIFRIVPSNGDLNFVFCDTDLGTSNTDGFIYYPSMAGVPVGTPTSYTGVIPTVIDSTNNRFYAYIGGAWRNLTGGSAGGSDTQLQYNNAGAFGGISGATSDGTNATFGSGNLRATSPRITTGILDSNGNELFLFTATASAVNEVTLINASTGLPVEFRATGNDTNIGINLRVKGTTEPVSLHGPVSASAAARTTGSPAFFFRVVTPADTGMSADTESVGMQIGGNTSAATATRTFTAGGGGFTEQREVIFIAPTYAFNSADTITDAIHVWIDTPRAGSNATLTNSLAMKMVLNANGHQGLWIDNSSASPSGNLFAAGVSGTKIFRIVPSNGDLNFVFCDSALGTTNTDGFIHYPSCAGTPTGVPTAYTGVVPTVIDTTNEKFYGYIGGSWVDLSGSGGGGSGTVNTGVQYEIAFYPANGTTVDGLANFLTDASGVLSHATSVRNAAAPTFYHRIVTPADTALTASTECIGMQLGGNTSAATVTRQWATGALTTQRETVFVRPTYAFVGASTLTNAATVAITGAPAAGTNATITNALALWVQAGESSFGDKVAFGKTNPIAPIDVESGDTGAAMLRMKHTDAAGFNSFDFIDSGGTQVFGVGYGNSGVASPFTSRAYFSILQGTNLIFMSAAVATNTARWAFMNGGDWVGNNAVVLGWSSSATDPTATRDTGLRRGAAGVVEVLASSTGSGALRRSRYVLGTTGSSTLSLGTTDSTDGIYYNTTSSTGLLTVNLPSAAAGLIYDGCCFDTDGIRIVAAAGDDIRVGTSISATAGRIDSSTVGAYISLVAIDATTWVARTIVGPWTVT